jgi:SAM-dependent methyltransferase
MVETDERIEAAMVGLSGYEREFARAEYGRGIAYYRRRLDALSVAGRRALDAGCGVGQWSMALAERFERVDALDTMASRVDTLRAVARNLGVENVHATTGNLERLPFADHTFDLVFCYGVIFMCDVRRALSEIFRVLAPGGRTYLCLNGDGWSLFLREIRGRRQPQVVAMADDTLYNTEWRRMEEAGLLARVRRAGTRLPRWLPAQTRYQLLARLSGAGAELRAKRKRIGTLFNKADQARFERDVAAVSAGDPPAPRSCSSQAYLPDELESICDGLGFVGFQAAEEGGLRFARDVAVDSAYEGSFRGQLSVWECVCFRPSFSPGPEYFRAGARRAREEAVWLPLHPPILSNVTRDTLPRATLEAALECARAVGGPKHFESLAEAVTEGATSSRDRVTRLIRFLQDALYHDPVSQPADASGQLSLDAMSILFTHRGRCGHVAQVGCALFAAAGFPTRLLQLERHVAFEARVDGLWIVVDADAFKRGVIPTTADGELLTLDRIREHPYRLDCFPTTGWFPEARAASARDALGRPVAGYADAADPADRGFLSGHYLPAVRGFPPSLPSITRFELNDGRITLVWSRSTCHDDGWIRYRVRVGTRSRGWSCSNPADGMPAETPADVALCEVENCALEAEAPGATERLFASVTAFNQRVEREPDTYFWASEEATCVA